MNGIGESWWQQCATHDAARLSRDLTRLGPDCCGVVRYSCYARLFTADVAAPSSTRPSPTHVPPECHTRLLVVSSSGLHFASVVHEAPRARTASPQQQQQQQQQQLGAPPLPSFDGLINFPAARIEDVTEHTAIGGNGTSSCDGETPAGAVHSHGLLAVRVRCHMRASTTKGTAAPRRPNKKKADGNFV